MAEQPPPPGGQPPPSYQPPPPSNSNPLIPQGRQQAKRFLAGVNPRIWVGVVIGIVVIVILLFWSSQQKGADTADQADRIALEQTSTQNAAIFITLTFSAITPTLDPNIAALQTQNAQLAQSVTDQAGTSQAILAQPGVTPQALFITATPLPSVVQPIANPPTLMANGSSSSSGGLSIFQPSGQSFGQYATDVTIPTGATGECGRIWQATNGQNLAWTAVFCNWKATTPALQMQWTIPTKAVVTGTGTLSFDLWRDQGASQSEKPDPYQVANAGNSSLGLAWFVRGTGGDVCVNGNCKSLTSGKTYQLGFSHDMTGFYAVAFTLTQGNMEFWQGEKQNSTDDWPQPITNSTQGASVFCERPEALTARMGWEALGLTNDPYGGYQVRLTKVDQLPPLWEALGTRRIQQLDTDRTLSVGTWTIYTPFACRKAFGFSQ